MIFITKEDNHHVVWLKKDHLYTYNCKPLQDKMVSWMMLKDLNSHSLEYFTNSYSIRRYMIHKEICVYTILPNILFMEIL